MITFTRRSLALLPAVAPLLSADLAHAAAIELNSAAVAYQTSDQIKWSAPSPNGARNAVLVGDPTKEGLYVQMVKWLGGDHFNFDQRAGGHQRGNLKGPVGAAASQTVHQQ